MLSSGSKAPAVPPQAPKGVAVLLVFYKISCPVCQLTLPYLNRLAHGSLAIVTISQDDASATQRFQTRFGVDLPTHLDTEEDGYPLSNAYGITHVPSIFLVEADGTISFSSEGFVKADLEPIAMRAGVELFSADEAVPAWKAG